MARKKKILVGYKQVKYSEEELKQKEQDILLLMDLVDIVRKSRVKEKSDAAFAQITKLMKTQIDKLVYHFNIPGHEKKDIEQEAMLALRYKAIKDYDSSRSTISDISPFDKFAILCMRRHLTTKRKASFQNKHWALNSAKSLDADNSKSSKSEDGLFLADIIPQKGGDQVDLYKDKEYFMMLMHELHLRLSYFEKIVLKLYAHNYSYQEIVKIINRKYKKRNVRVKSIDNALSRIKIKSEEVVEKYGDEVDRQTLLKKLSDREVEKKKKLAKKE